MQMAEAAALSDKDRRRLGTEAGPGEVSLRRRRRRKRALRTGAVAGSRVRCLGDSAWPKGESEGQRSSLTRRSWLAPSLRARPGARIKAVRRTWG